MNRTGTTFAQNDRVLFDGWDSYPPLGARGTVTGVRRLKDPDHPFAAPYDVRWDAGGSGTYSASMLTLAPGDVHARTRKADEVLRSMGHDLPPLGEIGGPRS